MVRIQLSLQWV